MVKCKHHKKCPNFRKNSYTCQSRGDAYCGIYRRLEEKSRKIRKRALLKEILKSELINWQEERETLTPLEAKSAVMLAGMIEISNLIKASNIKED